MGNGVAHAQGGSCWGGRQMLGHHNLRAGYLRRAAGAWFAKTSRPQRVRAKIRNPVTRAQSGRKRCMGEPLFCRKRAACGKQMTVERRARAYSDGPLRAPCSSLCLSMLPIAALSNTACGSCTGSSEARTRGSGAERSAVLARVKGTTTSIERACLAYDNDSSKIRLRSNR